MSLKLSFFSFYRYTASGVRTAMPHNQADERGAPQTEHDD
jgi:hypothetical protein